MDAETTTTASGEEFGWRGHLLPRLAPLGGIPAAIIWGLWHAPLIVQDGFNYPGHPWLGVVMMVVFTVPLGMMFAWLHFRSGSVWLPTLAHATFNAQAGFGIILPSHADPLLGAPISLIALIPLTSSRPVPRDGMPTVTRWLSCFSEACLSGFSPVQVL